LRRSGRNSSSVSSPARKRRVWSRNCATRSATMALSYASYLYMSAEHHAPADHEERDGEGARKVELGQARGEAAPDPDAGQRPREQAREHRVVDVAEQRVPGA